MKKLSMVLAVLVCATGVAWGQYATYDEALSAGVAKLKTNALVEARNDFLAAVALATTGSQKARAQFWIGNSHEKEMNTAQARTEYQKGLNLTDVDPRIKTELQYFLASCYQSENNYSQAKIEYAKVLAIPDGYPLHKFDAQRALANVYALEKNYDQAIVEYGKAVEISGAESSYWAAYFYRGKVKEQLKDWSGAKADYDEAWVRRPEDANQKKMIVQAIKDMETYLAE